MNFLFVAMLIPIVGILCAAFATFLKYRQHLALLEVLKIYARQGVAPPPEVLAALAQSEADGESPFRFSVEIDTNKDSSQAPKVQGPARFWSLVGLFSVLSAGFAYASWSSGVEGYPYTIVAFTMGAVAVWALIMAVALMLKK